MALFVFVCVYIIGLSTYTTVQDLLGVISCPPDFETIIRIWEKLYGCSTPSDETGGLQQNEKNDKLLTYPISAPFSKNRSEKCCRCLCMQKQKIFLCISLKRKISDVLCLLQCLAQQEVESKLGSEVLKKKEWPLRCRISFHLD